MRLDGYRKVEVDGDGSTERRRGRIKAVKETEVTLEALLRRIQHTEKERRNPGMLFEREDSSDQKEMGGRAHTGMTGWIAAALPYLQNTRTLDSKLP